MISGGVIIAEKIANPITIQRLDLKRLLKEINLKARSKSIAIGNWKAKQMSKRKWMI